MSSGGGKTVQTQSGPAEYLRPYLENQLQAAQDIYNRPYQVYGGQRIAGFTPDQIAYQQQVKQRAQSDNPYLQRMIDNAQGDITRNYNSAVKPQLDAAAVRAGAFGSSGWNQQQNDANRTLAEQLGRVDSDMRFQDYNNKRQDLAMWGGVANQQQQLGQSMLDQKYQDWLQQYLEPERRLDSLRGTLGTNYGSQSTQPNPNQSNTAANVLGGLSAAYGMYKSFF